MKPSRRLAATLAVFCVFAGGVAADDASSGHRHAASGVDVRSGWARASAGRAVNGAAYLVIANSGHRNDRLTGASSGVAERTEIHDHVDDNGVLRMIRLDGVDLPAGKTVSFRPGGRHIMLLNLREPLRAGDGFEVELFFASGARKRAEIAVRPIGAGPPGDGRHRRGHGGHD